MGGRSVGGSRTEEIKAHAFILVTGSRSIHEQETQYHLIFVLLYLSALVPPPPVSLADSHFPEALPWYLIPTKQPVVCSSAASVIPLAPTKSLGKPPIPTV